MKKLLLIGAVALFGAANAQHFGGTAGLALMNAKATYNGQKVTNSTTGGYVGLFGEFGLGDNFKFAPGVNYVFADGGGGLQIPLIFKYMVEDKFNLQFGPQLLFDTSEVPAEYENYYNKTNIGLAIGAGYDFTPKIFAEARYGFQLNNSFKNLPVGAEVTAKLNLLNIGVGYRFK